MLPRGDGDVVVHSQPGDWIDACGRPRPMPVIRRIAVLKPDHIGDLLISAEAFVKLRQFFPDAHITLFCGAWNVTLARALDVFDDIVGVDLFREVSGNQSDKALAAKAREAGVRTLHETAFEPFDIAVDFRFDDDSRLLLLNIDADIYAGFGCPHQFPFLDVMVPKPTNGWMPTPTETLVSLRRFGPAAAPPADGEEGGGGFRISSGRGEATLKLTIGGAVAPSTLGTSATDHRLLGVALMGIDLKDAATGAPVSSWAPQDLKPLLTRGWSTLEPWGVWSTAVEALVRLPFPGGAVPAELDVAIRLRGHINASNPSVTCQVEDAGSTASGSLSLVRPERDGAVSMRIPTRMRDARFASCPFQLGPGRYDGTISFVLPPRSTASSPARLRIVGQASHRVLVDRAFELKPASADRGSASGHVVFPFDVDAVAEEYRVEIGVTRADLVDGARVIGVVLRQLRGDKTAVPTAHMQDWSMTLALRLGQLFSPRFDHAAVSLGAVALGPSGRAAVERIRAWKDAGQVVVGVALGVNSEIRRWPREYFIDLCRSILALGRTVIVFIGGPTDRADALFATGELKLDPETHVLCGITPLDELGGLLTELDVFVGNNTGTTHYAGIVGVRTIGIYAGTNHPREWGPVGANASWIYRDEPCAPCHLTDLVQCRYGHSCMVDLLAEDVFSIIRTELIALVAMRQPRPADAMPRMVDSLVDAGQEA